MSILTLFKFEWLMDSLDHHEPVIMRCISFLAFISHLYQLYIRNTSQYVIMIIFTAPQRCKETKHLATTTELVLPFITTGSWRSTESNNYSFMNTSFGHFYRCIIHGSKNILKRRSYWLLTNPIHLREEYLTWNTTFLRQLKSMCSGDISEKHRASLILVNNQP